MPGTLSSARRGLFAQLALVAGLFACGGCRPQDTAFVADTDGAIAGLTQLLPVSATASSSEASNGPGNVRDGKFDTRWSALGMGVTLTADFGSPVWISGASIAWYKGSQRVEKFALAVSSDGAQWTQVYQGSSSGKTSSYDSRTFAAVTARYVRVTGNGNSQNGWNSITELRALTPTVSPKPGDGGTPDGGLTDGGVPDAGAADGGGPKDLPDGGSSVPASCSTNPWASLEACGWPGPKNTGPDLLQCPGGLTDMGSSSMPMPTLEISQDNTVLSCKRIHGHVHITARNVLIQNSYVAYHSGRTGTDANGTAPITIDDGASATVDHVEINGMLGTHACIWNQGTPTSTQNSLTARYVNCYNVNDGFFSWADTGYSQTTGDGFTLEFNYFHDFTVLTANGHEDGYQTEGASHGYIHHNTFDLTTEADSCVAIWNSLKSSDSITVEDNLMTGGGAAVYAEDYNPSESSPAGGFSVTNVVFKNNKFSTRAAPCVGQYFVWYARPSLPYGGGPTGNWGANGNTRTGNYVLETGQNVDNANPTVNGTLCQ